MRNLRILNRGQVGVHSRTYPDLQVVTSSFDAISDSITTVLSSEESLLMEVQQSMKNGEVKVLASFPVKPDDSLLSFQHFADSMQLIFVFQQGDIITASYDYANPDPDTTMVEIAGSIDCGLECAAWSPDEETLAIMTNEKNILLLSRLFEPISERFMNPNEITANNQVSVGWGKKETQFQGKGAKALEREREALKHAGLNIDSDNAILRDPTVHDVQNGNLSLYDTHKSKISWRGDCQFFSLTSIEEINDPSTDRMTQRRVIRVYTRDGELDSCSEAVDGQEDNLSWKPQGSLIASTQRRFEEEIQEEVLDLIFFERNGLRHGEFTSRLQPGSKIVDLDWSSNSEIIAFQLQNSIQIWSTKNYHWYLKQEIKSFENQDIKFMKFHPEKPLRLMIGTQSRIEIIDMTYNIISGPTYAPYDIGMTLVIDGNTCMVTPFSMANVPPPMSLREVDIDAPIIDLAVSQSNTKIAILSNESVELATFNLDNIIKSGKHPQIISKIEKLQFAAEYDRLRQVQVIKDDMIAVLFDSGSMSRIAFIDIVDPSMPAVLYTFDILKSKVVLIKVDATFEILSYELVNSEVYTIDSITFQETRVTKFPMLCTDYQLIKLNDNLNEEEFTSGQSWNTGNVIAFCMSQNGKLFANGKSLSSGVTSLLITESHLLYTTAQHQLKFVHLLNNISLFTEEGNENVLESAADDHDERTRMIERGSILVSAIPSKSSVILQAPRGNLETICPRIMVLTGVRQDIKAKNYKSAFMTCRTHRIALDILHDYDPALFFNNVELFINQLGSVEYLDLFLSCLLDEDVTETKYKETLTRVDEVTNGFQNININADSNATTKDQTFSGKEKVSNICEALLSVLLQPNYKPKYLQTIITAFACQHPPKTVEALELIGTFDNDSEIEKSVQHLCFLSDVHKLYDIALSIYNIPLTLVIAQQSQKDPKEYLPFLQNLHVQPELRKKFMIDTYLKRFEKALDSLTQITDEDQVVLDQEILAYVIDHALYKHALKIYRYKPEKYSEILKSYAAYLQSIQEYTEAGVTFDQLKMYDLALENYVMGKKWKEAMSLCLKPELKHKLAETSERLVQLLSDAHDYSSAAYIEFKYLKNIERSLNLYCKDYAFEQAILLCMEEENCASLIETVVDPALGEGFGTVAELLADCKGQVNSQLARLRELRAKKEEDPFAFYGENGENGDTPDNVSIAASETSTKESFFTRYTGKTAGTAKTGASRRTAKNRRREERKKARGKKGTIYEEEYLVKSIGRLLERLDTTSPEATRLIEGLLRRNMIEQAYQIQKNFTELITLIKEHIQEIYNISERDRERVDDNGIVYLVPEIPVPEVKDFPIKNVLDY